MSIEGQVASHNDEDEAMSVAKSTRPEPTIETVECPHCGMVIAKKRFAAHRRLHYPKPVKAQEAVKGLKKQPIGEVRFQSPTRGTRVTTPHLCNECGKVVSPTWRYPRSNRGQVHLCSPCKHKVFRRSFDDIDLMDTRLVVEHGRRDDEWRWDQEE
jgi:DNA-directed RNA polymerase subunit RPC12/RpoP